MLRVGMPSVLQEMHEEHKVRQSRMNRGFVQVPPRPAAPPPPPPPPPPPFAGVPPQIRAVLRGPRMRVIDSVLCDAFGVSLELLHSAARSIPAPLARQHGFYLARTLLGMTMPQIGRWYKRDHTSVLHGVRKIERLREGSEEFNDNVVSLIARVRELGA